MALLIGSEIYKQEQYRIQSLRLYTHNLFDVNLLFSYTEIGLFENLFESTMSGYVIVTDIYGMIENLNITGFCYLEINLCKFGENDPNPISKTFRIYKIGERVAETNNKETYTLHFCSEENILSEQIKIAKSYPNKLISDIVTDILGTGGLNVNSSKIGTIEPTTGLYSLVVPNIKPFEAINWLSTYARPTQYPGADMVFYESSDKGFNFRSIQSIYKDTVYAVYGYSPQNIQALGFSGGFYSILAYKYVQISDVMQGISDGMYANKLISVDPLLRYSNTTIFSYNDNSGSTPSYYSSAGNLNGNPVSVEIKNRTGKSVSQTSDAVVKVMTGNSRQTTFPAIQNNIDNLKTVVPNIAVETYIPNRTAQIPLANAIRVQFTIPGDIRLCVGKIVRLNLPSFRYNNDGTPNIDVYYSGNYMVSAVKHQFTKTGTYHCIVEGIADSVSKEYVSAAPATISATAGNLVDTSVFDINSADLQQAPVVNFG